MALANDLPRFLGLTLVGSAQPPPTLSVGQTTSLGQQTSYFSLLLPQTVMSRFPLVGLLSGTNLCPRSSRIPEINTIICRADRSKAVDNLEAASELQMPTSRPRSYLLYEYAYKSTANPFSQDSCKLGSVVLEGD
ncbi:hypothetical protein K1719_009473 [Acacia pycnantha]|nr:hypothetical protein K1719_009473 [Acacia pycnantha]